MPEFDPDQIVVAGSGNIYVASIDTPFPANVDTTPNPSDWDALGYVIEDGVTFSFAKEKTDIFAWQSFDPVRTIVTRVPKRVTFSLMQWNRVSILLALGGGTWTEPTAGQYHYEPPAASFVDYRALMVDFADGTKKYRFGYRRANNDEPLSTNLVRQDASPLPIGMTVLDPGGGLAPFFFDTNDPSFDELIAS